MMTNRNANSKPAGSLPTTWQLRTYDVWGNPKEGYQVNDVYSAGTVELRIPQTRHNIGTAGEFIGAYPSMRQIKHAFGTRCRIETDGDDIHIEITRRRDGYPIGHMECISHASLSPVRPIKLCPICGKDVSVTGSTTDGRLIGSCGDAFTSKQWEVR